MVLLLQVQFISALTIIKIADVDRGFGNVDVNLTELDIKKEIGGSIICNILLTHLFLTSHTELSHFHRPNKSKNQ